MTDPWLDERCPLQDVVDALFGPLDEVPDFGGMTVKEYKAALKAGPHYTRFQVLSKADVVGLPEDLMEVVETLAPGDYTRMRLCINLNNILSARGLTYEYGLVD